MLRLGLVAAIAAMSVIAGGGNAKPSAPPAAKPAAVSPAKEADIVLGSAKAAVTIIEYASVTCPHCAKWEAEVFPAFKAKYVDTGRVRYILREFITDPPEYSEAGFMIARCAPPSKFYAVVEALMANQGKLYANRDGGAWLLQSGAAGGLSEPQVKACVVDPKGQAALADRLEANAKAFDVEGTPTFVINGKKVGDGELTLVELDKAIAAAEAKPPLLRGPQQATTGRAKPKPKGG